MKKKQLLEIKKMLIILGLSTPIALSSMATKSIEAETAIEKDVEQDTIVHYKNDQKKVLYDNLTYVLEKDSEYFEKEHPNYQKIEKISNISDSDDVVDNTVYLYGVRNDNVVIDTNTFITNESNTVDATYTTYENTKTKQKFIK